MLNILATTAFGLEAVCRRELESLGYEDITVEDGKVMFEGTWADVARANLWLRTADRVLVIIGEFMAYTFEELFDKVYALPWDEWIDPKGNFVVNGRSHKSKLFSISDCQRITEKAIIKKLQTRDDIEWYEKSGADYGIEVAMLKDRATLTIDTSGEGLHKRGYRQRAGDAPLKETLAAALVLLSFWNPDRVLLDPFCGSGTILMEAAMIGRNMAPGIERSFAAEEWPLTDQSVWKTQRTAALNEIDFDVKLQILGSDIDHKSVLRARDNAALFGLEDDITFFIKDMRDVDIQDEYGVVITNPPYGKRLDGDMLKLYEDFAKKYLALETWSVYVITALDRAEKVMNKKASRRRKLFNGALETQYYQYYGPRPPKDK